MRRGHRVIGPEQIEARYGVPPSAWCCQTELAGDPSDGIKGIPDRHRSDHRPDRGRPCTRNGQGPALRARCPLA